jgi:lipid-binding SYLF domain-containing protein
MQRLNHILNTAVAMGLMWLLVPSSPSAISPVIPEDELLADATFVLRRVVDNRAAAIPLSVLMQAQAIAVFPGACKEGHRYYATGVMSARGASPNYWTPPAVLELEGALPLDLDSADVDFVLIAQTRRGLDYLIQERFTAPVIIPILPGALGHDTRVRIDADLVAYMQFGDYFAGVTVNDWMVSEAKAANARLYGRPYSTEDIVRVAGFFHLPPSARTWRHALVALFREMS